MSSLADQILQRLVDLEYQAAEVKRRMALFARSGVVSKVNADGSVQADLGFESHDIPVFTHAGLGSQWHPMKVGQQVLVLCPDGDIANAKCLPGGYHDTNPAPSKSLDEDIVLARGAVKIRATDSAAFIEVGSSVFQISDGKITLKSAQIVVDGETHLGGEGGVPAAMQGTIDTAGNADVANLATKVFVK